jgi:ABC-type antimicrobial peptide transport system permease subunit
MARRYFPHQDPIGKQIRIASENDEPWMEIIGIVSTTRSMRYNHTDWDKEPAVYSTLLQRQDRNDSFRRFASHTVYLYIQGASLNTDAVAAAVHGVDPDLPVQPLRTTGEIVHELAGQPRLRAVVFACLAGLTLLLAIIGVYGVVNQFVEQRRREIGIRVALGATSSDVMMLVVRRAGVLISVGLAIGLAGAIATARILRALLYGVSPFDPGILIGSIATLALVAALATYPPARRAVRIEPNITLQCE